MNLQRCNINNTDYYLTNNFYRHYNILQLEQLQQQSVLQHISSLLLMLQVQQVQLHLPLKQPLQYDRYDSMAVSL